MMDGRSVSRVATSSLAGGRQEADHSGKIGAGSFGGGRRSRIRAQGESTDHAAPAVECGLLEGNPETDPGPACDYGAYGDDAGPHVRRLGLARTDGDRADGWRPRHRRKRHDAPKAFLRCIIPALFNINQILKDDDRSLSDGRARGAVRQYTDGTDVIGTMRDHRHFKRTNEAAA
jgi:hypothetical protein